MEGIHSGDRSALDTVADGIRVRVIGDENKRIFSQHPNIHVIQVVSEEGMRKKDRLFILTASC